MAADSDTHPPADVLRNFGLGKLTDDASAPVLSHLEQCASCRQQVASLSGDSFLERLRAAQGRSSTPMPDDSLGELPHQTFATTGRPIIPDLPPELADHPQYEVVRELGRGGMGVVYLARNRQMDRLEVLKVMGRELLNQPGARQRFEREIRSAARLNHPNVVAAYSVLSLENLLVFAMEYVEGEDLAKVVKARGRLPVANACYCAYQAALGLQHALDKGMVHRDIKPQNLILTRDGQRHVVKILDFGLAKASREEGGQYDLTGEGKMLGTPHYIAPEQIRDAAAADIRADIYSLGCTLYALLAGEPPFSGGSLYAILHAHQEREARPLTEVRPDVPAGLAAVVRKMMAKDPAQRYQTPGEVAEALVPFFKPAAATEPEPHPVAAMAAAGGWETLSEPASLRPAARPVKMRRRLIGVGALAAAVLAGLVAAGVILKVKTKDGTLVVEMNEPNSNASVDGDKVNVSRPGGGAAEVRAKPGNQVEVTAGGLTTRGEKVTLSDAGREVLSARIEKPGTPPPGGPAGAPTTEDGFVSLFDGKDLIGWHVESGDPKQWEVEGDAIVGRSKDSSTHKFLLSNKDYGDFTLRFEFMVDPGSNGGVVLRAQDGERVPLRPGILIPQHPMIKLTDPAKNPGYPLGTTCWLKDDRTGVKPAEVPQLAMGEWYPAEVTLRGDACVATMAGQRVVDVKADPDTGTFVPALKRGKGKIGFHAHAGTVRFRNVRIRELGPAAGPAPQARGDGSLPFFNGKDLAGWNGLPGFWHVEDGAIVGRCPPGRPAHTFLFSDKPYRDFDLRFRVRRKDGVGNSGVQFRSQVKDPERCVVVGPQCEIDSANFEFPPGSLVTEPNLRPLAEKARPAVAALYRDADFNDFHIRCVGKHVTIKVNGVTAVYGDFPSLPDEGVIAWQLHGRMTCKEVTFRDILFTDLGPARPRDGFVPLFNGKDLSGWKTHPQEPGNWRVENGVLTGSGAVTSHLYTERGDYKDFHLKVEARINAGGNSGVFFRSGFGPAFPARDPRFPIGYEAQIRSPTQGEDNTGCLYAGEGLLVQPERDVLMASGEWFPMEVLAEGDRVTVKVGDRTTAIHTDDQKRYRRSGHIALQLLGRDTVAEFRKVEIKELPATPAR